MQPTHYSEPYSLDCSHGRLVPGLLNISVPRLGPLQRESEMPLNNLVGPISWTMTRSSERMTRSDWIEVCGDRLHELGIKNFTPLEICDVGRTSGDTILQAPDLKLLENAVKLIDILSWLREEEVTAPVLVNSWYRDPDYNQVIGGVGTSMHITCGAADVVKGGYSPTQVADMLERHPLSELFGIGRYNTFTHIDIRGMVGRPAPARW